MRRKPGSSTCLPRRVTCKRCARSCTHGVQANGSAVGRELCRAAARGCLRRVRCSYTWVVDRGHRHAGKNRVLLGACDDIDFRRDAPDSGRDSCRPALRDRIPAMFARHDWPCARPRSAGPMVTYFLNRSSCSPLSCIRLKNTSSHVAIVELFQAGQIVFGLADDSRRSHVVVFLQTPLKRRQRFFRLIGVAARKYAHLERLAASARMLTWQSSRSR